mmetsp:Transcript_31456/g.62169  ORF Transcript_31456/g.62169 Transcript_31456/m.62169 type:complete len:136 (-) Transcript_31456:349-756(-)
MAGEDPFDLVDGPSSFSVSGTLSVSDLFLCADTVAQYVADGGNRNGFCMTVYDLGCGVSRSLLILTVAIQKTGVFVKRCVGIEGDTSRYLLSSLFVSKCSKKLKEEGRFPPAGIEIVQGDFTSPVIFKKSCFSLS